MRSERQLDFVLTSEHLPALMHEIRLKGIFAGAAIVGDEPLQSKVWPYTYNFLKYADDAGVPSALDYEWFRARLIMLANWRSSISLNSWLV